MKFVLPMMFLAFSGIALSDPFGATNVVSAEPKTPVLVLLAIGSMLISLPKGRNKQ